MISGKQQPRSEIIFLGTGTSEGIPRLSCLIKPSDPPCKVCTNAMQPGSKNRRRNTCLLLRTYRWERINKSSQDEEPEFGWVEKVIMIDCGKFWWHSAIEHFPRLGIKKIDAILITHAHADAIGGFDDLRDLTHLMAAPLPIYLRQQDFDYVNQTMEYLVDKRKASGSFVSTLKFTVIDESAPFTVEGVTFVPLPVQHGTNYTALGFKFGNVVYISDCNYIGEETRQKIRDPVQPESGHQPIEVMILDSLCVNTKHSSHFCLEEAIEEFRLYRPKKAFAVGMNHEVDHYEVNEELKKLKDTESLDIELAYDGLVIPVSQL